jgi:thiol-disulfide isomerase/thioredoxin
MITKRTAVNVLSPKASALPGSCSHSGPVARVGAIEALQKAAGIAGILVAMFVPLQLPAGAAEALNIGDAFPDLKHFQLEGRLPDALKGKVVLVDFWASWCAPCKASFPAMSELHKRYAEKGLVILAISVDEQKEAMERFLKKNPAPFAVVRDPTQKLASAVNARTMPSSFLLDAEGRVRFLHDGFTAETSKAYGKEIEELLKLAPK